jgi:hypothetical protein
VSEVVTRPHYDAGERKFIFQRVQDVEPIIENNKRLQSMGQSRKSDFRHIASIPNIFLERWLNEEYARGNTSIRLFSEDMDKLVARKLRDPEWKFLRTDK